MDASESKIGCLVWPEQFNSQPPDAQAQTRNFNKVPRMRPAVRGTDGLMSALQMAWQEQRPGANLTPRNFMNLLSRRWSVLLVTLLLSATSLRSAEEEKPGILFLCLQLKDGAFSLVSATNVSGTLKTPRRPAASKELQMVVEDAAGTAVWTQEMADPSVERLEYTDPAQPGVIQGERSTTEASAVHRARAARVGQKDNWRFIAAPRLPVAAIKKRHRTGHW